MPTEPVARHPRARLDRLVSRFLLGQVVPFLGAGFSQGARWEEDIDGEARPPLGAGAIAQRLADDLMNRYYASEGKTGPGPTRPHPLLHETARRTSDAEEDHLIDVHGMLGKLSTNSASAPVRGEKVFKSLLGTLQEEPAKLVGLRDALCKVEHWREAPPLGEIAELHSFVFTPKATVELLQLGRWRGYRPTPAHHYLAILIREGCITEVFETNYDPFVEQAVLETYGEALSARAETSDVAPVIHDLGTFREHVGEPRQGRRRRALVKVVKLNGCATAYLGERCEPAAIVLTEAQLQTWGAKHWARDLLHVAVRSKSLCFLGFGASDPIVRYHALEVMREFHTGNDGERAASDRTEAAAAIMSGRPWFELNNAPFVGEYKDGLTFYQHQILRSFYQAHLSKAERDGFTSLDRVEENAFTGRDGPWFARMRGDASWPGATLPADLLLSVVVPAAVCRLASERYLSRSGAAHAYLQGALRFPSTLLSLVRRAYLQADDPDALPPLARWMQLPNTPYASKDQPEPRIDAQQTSSLWARLCFALGGRALGRAGYRSFEDHPIELPMFLVLLYIVRAAQKEQPVPSDDELEKMLCVEGAVRLVKGDRMHGRPDVYVCRNVDSALRPESGIRDQSVILALTRGNLHPYVHPSRGAFASNSGSRTWSTRRVYVLSDLDALRGARPLAVDLSEAQRNITRAIHQPERFIQHERGWREYCVEGAIR